MPSLFRVNVSSEVWIKAKDQTLSMWRTTGWDTKKKKLSITSLERKMPQITDIMPYHHWSQTF